MDNILEQIRKGKVDDTTMDSLIAKCQENEWVKRGGYAWQDDPYLEEYPYSVSATESLDELREYFRHGNWAIRQGVIFKDLAFIQQDDGGDEWWTLKRIGSNGVASDWLAFESWSFHEAAQDPHEFSDIITSMLAASIQECQRLEYGLPRFDVPWELGVSAAKDWDGEDVECRSLKSREGSYEIIAYERPSFEGAMLEIFDCETRCIIALENECDSITKAAKSSKDMVAKMIENRVRTPEQWKSVLGNSKAASLEAVVSEVRKAADVLNSSPSSPNRTDRQRS